MHPKSDNFLRAIAAIKPPTVMHTDYEARGVVSRLQQLRVRDSATSSRHACVTEQRHDIIARASVNCDCGMSISSPFAAVTQADRISHRSPADWRSSGTASPTVGHKVGQLSRSRSRNASVLRHFVKVAQFGHVSWELIDSSPIRDFAGHRQTHHWIV